MPQQLQEELIDLDAGSGEETYERPLGKANLIASLDGTVHWTMDKFMHDPEHIALMMKEQQEPVKVSLFINAYLVFIGAEVILVDTDFGTSGGPGTGMLIKTLERSGFNAASVTVILLTHLHLDHADGVSERKEILFPNAPVYVAQKEMNYWFDPKNAEAAPEDKKHGFREALLQSSGGRVKMG